MITEMLVMVIDFLSWPLRSIDINILDANSMMNKDSKRTQRNARHIRGSCLVGAHQGVLRPGGSCREELELERGMPRRFGFPCPRSVAPQRTPAGQHHWSQSVAHAGIDQCRGGSLGEESACETQDHRR